MTDTTQQTQGQQGYTDDALTGEDIFAAIPPAQKDTKMDYNDIIEDKYQFTPIPENIDQVLPEVISVVQPAKEISEPIKPVPVEATPVVQQQRPVVTPKPVPEIETPVPETKQREIPTPVVQTQRPVVTSRPVPAQQPAKEISEPIKPVSVEATPVVQAQRTVVAPKQAPVQTPVPEPKQREISAPLKEVEPIQKVEEKEIEVVPSDTQTQTDVQKKFGELFSITKKIYELKNKMGIVEETFDILGANNDKLFISYRFLLDETDDKILFITKIEQDKETEEENVNELKFTLNKETSSLEVVVNDILLFNEIQDFTEDQKKKLQVIDKINKFTFLSSEELRKLDKEIKEKEEAERERRKLQEIFRNF